MRIRRHALPRCERPCRARLIPHSERQASVTEMHQRKNRLLRVTGRRVDENFSLPPSDARVVEAENALEEAERKVQRLQRLDAERSPAWVTASRLAQRAETEIRNRPGGTTWHDADEPALPNGELVELITRQRVAIADKKAEIERLASATVTRADAKRLAREQLDAITRAPDLTGLKHGLDMLFPVERLRVEMFNTTGGALGFTSANDGSGLMAWLFCDELLQRIDTEVDAMIGAKEGMTATEREKMISKLEADLMDLERVDAEMTWRAIAGGQQYCSP